MRWFDGITDSMDISFSKLGEIVDTEARRAAIHGVLKSQNRTAQLNNKRNSDPRSWMFSEFSYLFLPRKETQHQNKTPARQT